MRYSVILPTHRNDPFLAQAVASTEAAIAEGEGELIIIANGPDCHRIAERFSGSDAPPRRRVLVSELPSLSHALNLGLEAARGEYVARMDGDDICLPDRFSRQLAFLARSPADFLFTDVTLVDADDRELPDGRRPPRRHPVLPLPIWHPTAMIRRSALIALGGYGNLEFAEDHHLWLRASARGFRLAKMPTPTIRYRVHGAQQTADANKVDDLATLIGLDGADGLRRGDWRLVFHAMLHLIPLVRWRLKLARRKTPARAPAPETSGISPALAADR